MTRFLHDALLTVWFVIAFTCLGLFAQSVIVATTDPIEIVSQEVPASDGADTAMSMGWK